MWIAICLSAVALGYAILVARTAKMNADPLQKELAALIMEMMAAGADRSAQTIFGVSVMNRFVRAMVLDEGARQSRLAHALSMCRPHLSAVEFQEARHIIRSI